MICFDEIPAIYMAKGYTDMRKGIDGFAHIIQDGFHLDPFQDALFIFCNKQRDKMKCLYWDGSGFWLLYKRLEKGRFKWKSVAAEEVLMLSHQQWKWLLEGLKIEQKTAFKTAHPKYI